MLTVLIRVLNYSFLIYLSNLIMIFGWKLREKDCITERTTHFVDAGHLEGVDQKKKSIIFQFGDSQSGLMIPRTDIAAVDVNSSFDEIWEQKGNIPVCRFLKIPLTIFEYFIGYFLSKQ